MNAARRATRAGRNLLLALLVGAVLIAGMVVAYVAGRGAGPPHESPPASTITEPAAVSPSTASNEKAPSGCLGGDDRDSAMLLAAQRQAPHSAYGAVDVVAAFFRWAYRYPYPSASQARQVSAKFVSASAPEGFKDIAGSYLEVSDITNGQLPKGTPFYLSTTGGRWRVSSSSTADRVTVDLSAPYVLNDAVSPSETAAISATVVWTGGEWRLLSEQGPDLDALAAGGTQFTAGC